MALITFLLRFLGSALNILENQNGIHAFSEELLLDLHNDLITTKFKQTVKVQ